MAFEALATPVAAREWLARLRLHTNKPTHAALYEKFGRWPIFEHCLPFDVARLWDELSGVNWPRIWTARRDREVWDQLQTETGHADGIG